MKDFMKYEELEELRSILTKITTIAASTSNRSVVSIINKDANVVYNRDGQAIEAISGICIDWMREFDVAAFDAAINGITSPMFQVYVDTYVIDGTSPVGRTTVIIAEK